jgi:lipoteichoic acid synthase
MVQLEAFNNWFIGKKVNGQEITPNINKLVKETMYYDNFYRETAQGRTSDAEFLTNESMLPLSSGSADVRFANDDFDSLASTLKENGYQTAAFHAYTKSFWNRYAMYQNHGFDTFYSKEDFKPGEIAGWALGDRPFFQQSIDKMLTMKKPFYAFMISLSSHHPYDIQSKYRTLDVTGYSGIFADYLESVHYVDASIGDMVARLKKEGLWDNTILVMYGDHDYGVDDDKDMLKIAGMTDTPLHAEEKFDQVPFIIHLPHSEKPGTYTKTAGQVDVAPTILHALGISTSNKYMMGSNILTKGNNLVPFRYGSYTNGKVFFVGAQDGMFEHGTCYDMTTEAQVNVEQCRPDYSKAREMYKVSDNVIYGNLIKEFRNKK